jgi:CRP-like cAMP-binding protein
MSPQPCVSIRLAQTPGDRAAVYRLRYELYVEGQGLFAEVADHERRWLAEPEDEHATIVIATVDERVVGTARLSPASGELGRGFAHIVPPEAVLLASRMLIDPRCRDGRLAEAVTVALFEHAIARGAELIVAECELHLLNKWMGLCFRPVGMREHPLNGGLVELALVLGDVERARRLGSPLLPVLEGWAGSRECAAALTAEVERRAALVSAGVDRRRFWACVDQTCARPELGRWLGGLDDEELDVLLARAHFVDCQPGVTLSRRGHVSRTLYVLLSGSLRVEEDGELVAEVDAPGECVGEVVLFDRGVRMSDVVTGERGARVLALSGRRLERTLADHEPSSIKLMLALARGLCAKLRQRSVVMRERAETYCRANAPVVSMCR